MSDDPTVSYPLNDVLERIEGKVDKIGEKLDEKIGDLDRRVRELELERAERAKAREVISERRQAESDSRRTTWAMVLGAAAAAGAIADAIVQGIGH